MERPPLNAKTEDGKCKHIAELKVESMELRVLSGDKENGNKEVEELTMKDYIEQEMPLKKRQTALPPQDHPLRLCRTDHRSSESRTKKFRTSKML